jgi:hypothetical protein
MKRRTSESEAHDPNDHFASASRQNVALVTECHPSKCYCPSGNLPSIDSIHGG